MKNEFEELDIFSKNQLDNLEITPPPQVWKNVKKELPLSLWVRNQLNWLSGIAAALVIIMVALLTFNTNTNLDSECSPLADASLAIAEQSATPTPEAAHDFVFAMEEPTSQQTISASMELSLEDEKTIESFWSDVMETPEDEIIVKAVEDEIIEKSLEPILELPIENIEAAVNSTVKK